jgi:hypothetical protein
VNDFISEYLRYIGITETPAVFNRWSCIGILGALVGKGYNFQHGHFNVRANMYIMLLGNAGSRKSTAIKVATKLLRATGYTSIAADRSTKEKLLLDLAGESSGSLEETDEITDLDAALFGKGGAKEDASEMLIAADEFNVFIGNGNIEFLSMLGSMWDHSGTYENKVKNSKSVKIQDPYISILAGNTATGFSMAFPQEAIGQGIFSRIILVQGDATGRKIAFPEAPSAEATAQIVKMMHEIKMIVGSSTATMTLEAKEMLAEIYNAITPLSDIRFESYMNRRFTHLIKLCMICSAASFNSTITVADVIYANTILTHTEHGMSRALGEFGKSRNSDVSHKLVQVLESAFGPMTIKQLWKHVSNDIDDISKMSDVLNNLVVADKIIVTKVGYIAKRKRVVEGESAFVDFNLLTEEERNYVI